MVAVRILVLFFLLLIFNQPSFAKPSDQDHLKDYCSGVDIEKLSPDKLSEPSYEPDKQKAIICSVLNDLSKGYAKTAFKDFDADFYTKKTLCMNLVSSSNISKKMMHANLMRCGAYFKDGHISLGIKNLKTFYLPFRLLESQERFFVSEIHFYACGETKLRIGDEVISIGGESPKNIQNKLRRFVGGSSEAFRLKQSNFFMTQRNFEIPSKGAREVVFIRNGVKHTSLETWRFNYADNPTYEDKALLKKGFKMCMVENSVVDKGYHSKKSLYTYERPVELSRDVEGKGVFLSYGKTTTNGNKICALKLKTFLFEDVYYKGQKVDVWKLLNSFLDSCVSTNRQIVMDLRNNNGGYLVNLNKFTKAYGDKKMMTQAKSLVYFATNHGVFPRDCSWKGIDESKINEFHFDRLRSVFCLFTGESVEKERLYSLPTILLTTEDCISSCDYFALFAKASDSIIQLGSATHGAFLTLSGKKNIYGGGLYQLRYPDGPVMMSAGQKDMRSQKHSLCLKLYGSGCFITLERKPIKPDYFYKASRKDIVSKVQGQGWREKIDEVMKTLSTR